MSIDYIALILKYVIYLALCLTLLYDYTLSRYMYGAVCISLSVSILIHLR